MATKRKTFRNPNGYGSVHELSGNRRRPWRVRITKGWSEDNKQLYETIGYFETRKDAMIALAKYNENPWDIKSDKLTFHNVYELSQEEIKDKGTKMNQSVMRSSYKYVEPIKELPLKEIKTLHLQKIIDNMEKSIPTKKKVKQIFNQVYKYALKNDLIEKDYAALVEIKANENVESESANPFNNKEIKAIFNDEEYYHKITKILIMTGFRINELLSLKTSNIDFKNNVLIGGSKTTAGKNRIVPISRHIKNLLLEFYNENNEYLLLNNQGNKYHYHSFRVAWKERFSDHKLHDTRHTFASLFDNAGANDTAIKKIIGHSLSDITKGTYTHKSLKDLQTAIDKLDDYVESILCI